MTLLSILLLPAVSLAAELPATISENTTLIAEESPYTGTSVTIAEGVTLTVEPGVVVRLSGTLTANGTLDVNGTEEEAALFTSSSDSAPGQWTGIALQSGAGGSTLAYAEVRYAKTGIAISNGIAPTVEHSNVHQGSSHGISVSGGGSPEIADNEVSDNSSRGISYSASTGSEGQVNIHDNLVERNGGDGISVDLTGSAEVEGLAFSGNEVNENGDEALSYDAPAFQPLPPDVDENTLSENAKNGLWLQGDIETTEWNDYGFPIVLDGTSTVLEEETLTLEPGLVVKGGSSAPRGGLTVEGSLVADGTEGEPIVFTSERDDTVGGDTNGDEESTKPAPGDWIKIEFDEPEGGTLDHTTVDYAGWSNSSGNYVALRVDCPCSSVPAITNSTIANSEHRGVTLAGADSVVAESEIVDNEGEGIQTSGGSPEITENTISRNGSIGINYSAATLPNTSSLDVDGNTVEENGSIGIKVSAATGSTGLDSASLGNNSITGNGGKAIEYNAFPNSSDSPLYDGNPIAPNITTNTLSENAENGIWVGGEVSESVSWEDPGYALVVFANGVSVADGATLTLGPGIVLKNDLRTLYVHGALNAEGTSQSPVTFTSVKDDSVAGDTNGDESATEPQGGDWRSLYFQPNAGTESGGSALDHVKLRYGGKKVSSYDPAVVVDCPCPNPPRFLNADFSHSYQTAFSVKGNPGPTVDGKPVISHSRFRDIPGLAISKSSAESLWAPYNDFGCASGPSPYGCGESVSENVDWTPLEGEEGKCRGKQTKKCKHGADPVALSTGALAYSHRDLLLSGKSLPLEFARSYNSADPSDASLGYGWSHNGLIIATELESGDVIVRHADGRTDLYTEEEGEYVAPGGITDELDLVEGAFRLTMLDQTVYDFGPDGRIEAITDDHGLQTTYGYDGNGRLGAITDPSEQSLSFSYDGSNHITKVTDSTGREVKYTYTEAGDLGTATDALGGVTEYSYDSEHRITAIKDPRENTILQNIYDEEGRVVEQLDGLEHPWTLEYEEDETIVTEPEGGETAYAFDEEGRVVSETDQLGNKTTTGYDGAGNIDEVVQPGGAKWQLGYDGKGNLTSVVDPEEGQRSYEYDGQNRMTSFTDAREQTWSYEWDEAGDLIKITDPAEGEAALTYDEDGLPLTITDPNEHMTTFTYDGRGNRLSVEDPLEHKTTLEYDSRNNVVSVTEPGLEPEELSRNALGELTSRTTPEGHTTSYAYNATGMPIEIIDPAENVWKIAYNAMGRPTTYTDPAEQQATVAYDGNLKPTKVTDRRGKETTFAYDLANRRTKVTRPEAGIWAYGYDTRGNRTSVVDPRENETTYEYDLLDRMTKADEPLEVSSEYGYDAEGNLTSVTDPRENTTSYEYDTLGRPTAIKQPLEKTTTLSYDGVGNLLSRTTAAGTLEYGYDAADRLQEVSTGETTLRSFGYDEADRMTAATDAQGKEIEIGYEEDGKVTSIDDGRGQSLTRSYNSRGYLTKQVDGRGTLEYGYDELGRLTALTDPQEETSTFAYDAEANLTEISRPGGIATTNAYDNAGRLSETTSQLAGEPPTVLEALEYSYDAAGNVLKRIDARLEEETTYAYDALNRLTEFNPPGEEAISYTYDATGNRTEAAGITYTYNALNQLTEASDGTTYGYDEAGRLTSLAEGEEETTFEWDLFDHLATVKGPGATASYTYDALDRLSERTSGSGTTRAHYGDLTDLPTYDASGEGETTTSYVYGAGGLLEQRSGEATVFPLADAHGDVTAISTAEGEVASRQSYDPWGAQFSGPTLEMGYLGAQQRRFDPASGLIQMGARSYSPALGRFMSEDPVLGHLGVGTSFDRYAYAWDNPLSFYDLDGRDVCVPTPFGDACAGEAAEGVGNATGNVGRAAGSATESVWNWTQPGRQWFAERAQDLVKELSFSDLEALGNALSALGAEAACWYARSVVTSAPTPPSLAVKVGAAATCAYLTYSGAAQLGTDLADED